MNSIIAGLVSTVAGTGSTGSPSDGTATLAVMSSPAGCIYMAATNTIYVSDQGVSNRVRAISLSSGIMSTFAGSTTGTADGTGTSALFSSPAFFASDSAYLYLTDNNNNLIRRISYPG